MTVKYKEKEDRMSLKTQLNGYFAVKQMFKFENKTATKVIEWINNNISQFCNDEKLILLPRIDGRKNVSFRYCGLEILNAIFYERYGYKLKGKSLNGEKKKVFDLDKDEDKNKFNFQMKNKIFNYINSMYLGKEKIKKNKKNKKIQGFQPEHWLESIFCSNTSSGSSLRSLIGAPLNAYEIISQVPVICIKKRSLHIDSVGFHRNGLYTLIELKIDADLDKAKK